MFVATLLVSMLTTGCAAKHVAELGREIQQRDAVITDLREVNHGLALKVETLEAESAQLAAKNVELAAFYATFADDFRPELATGEASLVVYPDRTAIVAGDAIAFASGSAKLNAESAPMLDKLAAFIKDHPDRRFQVEGHTDSEPIHNAQFASNWELGSARAVAVVNALIARGVSASQLTASSYGENAPLVSNDLADGMAANRRIAVSVETSIKESGAQVALFEAARAAGAVEVALNAGPPAEPKVATRDSTWEAPPPEEALGE